MADSNGSSLLKLLPTVGTALAAGALGFIASNRSLKTSTTRSKVKELPIFYRYAIDYSMHQEHREKLLARFAKLKNVPCHSAIILQGGSEPTRYDTDAGMIQFRQESFFYYLFGINEPGCFGVIDLDSKKSILFTPFLDDDYELWQGPRPKKDDIRAKYGVDEVYFTTEMVEVLQSRNIRRLYRLKGLNTDSFEITKTTAQFEGMDKFELEDSTLHPELVECRVFKTQKEIDIMRYITKCSSEAHIQVMKRVVPGMYEYQMESLFLHECYFRGGARFHAYVCICGAGHSASFLHYGTNDKLIKDGVMVLNDMGSEYHGYASDITCSFPANGKFTADQKLIYEGVLLAHDRVIEAMRPGVSWPDMHMLSHRVMTEYFVKHGLFVNGSVDELMAAHVSSFFYQHGLGHLIGLDVHDVGGYPGGTSRAKEPPELRPLRCGRILEEGMCITVEPGWYFIDAFIDRAFADEKVAKYLNRSMVNKLRGFGGVRIESDVVLVKGGVENLTHVPRTVDEIERLMESGSWK